MKLPFPQNVGRMRIFAGHRLPDIYGWAVPTAHRVREAMDRTGEIRPLYLVCHAIHRNRSLTGSVLPSANGFLRHRLAQRFVY